MQKPSVRLPASALNRSQRVIAGADMLQAAKGNPAFALTKTRFHEPEPGDERPWIPLGETGTHRYVAVRNRNPVADPPASAFTRSDGRAWTHIGYTTSGSHRIVAIRKGKAGAAVEVE